MEAFMIRKEKRKGKIRLLNVLLGNVICVANDVIGADQKIPDQSVKTTLLGKVITVNRLVMKSWFGDMGLA